MRFRVLAGAAGGLLGLCTLPRWLPRSVVALRMRIFAKINGDEGIPVPGPQVDVTEFRRVYSDPAANGRSRGAVLSDLFWYWLAPGPEVHQEHIEPGPRYAEVARATRRILARAKPDIEQLTARCASHVLDELNIRGPKLVRLRDVMMPIWAELHYELVFGEPCPPEARDLIVGNANDVVTALKCCGLRHMGRRHRLTRYLIERVRAGDVPHELPGWMSVRERALYLQGAFFNTAVVQMSEAMTHLFLVLAQHQDIQRRVSSTVDGEYLGHVMDETLRVYPLFGIAHRITTGDIDVGTETIPSGSVLCFNYPDFHRSGFDDPERFDPDRWATQSTREANFIPYGVVANRACPARGVAPHMMRAAAREMVRRFTMYSSVSHTRSIPHRGPCLVVPPEVGLNPVQRKGILAFMRIRDRWEDVWRSLVQLVFGSYMVWDARRKRLCQRYFAEQDRVAATARPAGPTGHAGNAQGEAAACGR
jgi:hypothetical protein